MSKVIDIIFPVLEMWKLRPREFDDLVGMRSKSMAEPGPKPHVSDS